MYSVLKKIALRILKVPPEPLDPMGDVGSLKVFRASPNFFRYRFYLWSAKNLAGAFTGAVMAGIMLAFLIKQHPGFAEIFTFIMTLSGIILLGLINLAVSYVLLRLDYEMRWYKLTDRSLRIREGVFFVRELTMTFANIQNISISQGPIQRLFRIADLKVETAGGGGRVAANQPQTDVQFQFMPMHIGYFRGVDNFNEICELMMARLKKMRDAGLGDTDDSDVQHDPSVENPAFGGSLPEILLSLRDETAAFRKCAEKLQLCCCQK